MQKYKYYLVALGVVVLLAITYKTFDNTFNIKPLEQSKNLPVKALTDTVVIPVKALPRKAAERVAKQKIPVGQVVTAATETKPSRTGYDVISTIDTQTGINTLMQREKPENAVSFEATGRYGVTYGVNSKGSQIVGIEAEYTPLRVLSTNISVDARAKAELMSNGRIQPDLYIGVQAWKEFDWP